MNVGAGGGANLQGSLEFCESSKKTQRNSGVPGWDAQNWERGFCFGLEANPLSLHGHTAWRALRKSISAIQNFLEMTKMVSTEF